MKKLALIIASATFCCIMTSSCNDNETDTEKPVIDLTIQDAFPLNGDTLYFGESFTLKMRFSDNQELGTYNVDLHNNFDHHSHSTEVDEVILNPVKTPINPFTLIQDNTLPSGSTIFETSLEIELPDSNSDGVKYDDGDYHFMVSLTDHEGWSVNKGLSIKILHR